MRQGDWMQPAQCVACGEDVDLELLAQSGQEGALKSRFHAASAHSCRHVG